MTLDEELSKVKLIYVETSPFIYFAEWHPDHAFVMRALFRYVIGHEISVLTSVLTVSEAITKPLKNDDQKLTQRYTRLSKKRAV